MPNIKVIQAAIAELPKGSPLVVAISGGTTGIGAYIAKAFATTFKAHGSRLRVYIIGRNASRAESVISEGKAIATGSEWRFIKATDLSLISEVDRCCSDIIKHENDAPFAGGPARLDLLYMTHSAPTMQAAMLKPNSEGLDPYFSTLYYSRIRMIAQLTPLLEASVHESRVISVFAGSTEEVSANEEPPTGCPSRDIYGIGTVRKNVVFMKNFVFERLATQHAGKISFIHIYPGLVDGPGFYDANNPLWFKVVYRLLYALLWLTFMTQPDTCGQVMAYLATDAFPAKSTTAGGKAQVAVGTDGTQGGGAYAVGQRADAGNKQGVKTFAFRDKDVGERVWTKTMEVFEKLKLENAGGS